MTHKSKIIILGDLHARYEEPFRYHVNSLLDWLYERYKNDILLQTGDLFHSSNPHNEVRCEIMKKLSLFKEVHILDGNHDVSKRAGNSLSSLLFLENTMVYSNECSIIIEGINFYFIPFSSLLNREQLETLTGIHDFIVTHITPVECAFNDEGIQLNLKGKYIHGHTHIPLIFKDKNNNEHHVIGVPLPTRYGEHLHEPKIIEICPEEKKINYINVPKFFTYENIEYGDEPKNKNNIINVLNAPDKDSVFKKYGEYYIRRTGITLQRNEVEIDNSYYNTGTIFDKFKDYYSETVIDSEIINCCVSYLNKAQVLKEQDENFNAI